jgi:hypothetical protein
MFNSLSAQPLFAYRSPLSQRLLQIVAALLAGSTLPG